MLSLGLCLYLSIARSLSVPLFAHITLFHHGNEVSWGLALYFDPNSLSHRKPSSTSSSPPLPKTWCIRSPRPSASTDVLLWFFQTGVFSSREVVILRYSFLNNQNVLLAPPLIPGKRVCTVNQSWDDHKGSPCFFFCFVLSWCHDTLGLNHCLCLRLRASRLEWRGRNWVSLFVVSDHVVQWRGVVWLSHIIE